MIVWDMDSYYIKAYQHMPGNISLYVQKNGGSPFFCPARTKLNKQITLQYARMLKKSFQMQAAQSFLFLHIQHFIGVLCVP